MCCSDIMPTHAKASHLEAEWIAHLNRLRAVVAKGRQRQEQEAAVRHHSDARLRAALAPPKLSVEALAGTSIPGEPNLRQVLTKEYAGKPKQTLPALYELTSYAIDNIKTCIKLAASLFPLALKLTPKQVQKQASHAGQEAGAHRAMSHCRKRRPRSMTAGSVSTRCFW